MPKKFHGENSKASVAKARKDAIKQAEVEKKERDAEDALWKDEDKHVQRKQQRKEEKEKRKLDVAERKAVSKQLLDEEMSSLKAIKPTTENKVTRSQIAANKQAIQNAASKPDKVEVQTEAPLEENINRAIIEGDQARTIDEAIAVLSVKEDATDLHPERRIKAAYAAFEEENLPRLKAENPTLRLSQLKQILRKDWMKSPQNPLIHG